MKLAFRFSITSRAIFSSVAVTTAIACAGAGRTFDSDRTDEAPIFSDAAVEAPSCQAVRCSRDLKKVLKGCDGAEQVIAECGPDQGCGAGRCIEACASAEISKGSIGCSFSTVAPDTGASLQYEPKRDGSCFAAMIANTWDRATTISGALGGEPLELSRSIYRASKNGADITYTKLEGPLPPGEVALVFLSQGDGATPCPDGVEPALHEDSGRIGTGRLRAFRLTTDVPVSAYSIYPYGGAASYLPTATLLLPVSSWGTNYLAVTAGIMRYFGQYWPVGWGNLPSQPSLQIVAAEDGTEVRMRPRANILGAPDVAEANAGSIQKWTLSRGEVLQITQDDELTGSPIEADKPIALFGGTQCMSVPYAYPACDVLQQQIPPLSQWGSEYALVPHRPRLSPNTDVREDVPYRLIGAVDGTTLTYDPVRPADAPQTLSAGQAVFFATEKLVSVKSQDAAHPFYAAVYMTGGNFNLPNRAGPMSGDPDFVNVVPADQYLDHYVFFADYTYPETTLTFVRRKTTKGFLPVELDCAGEITGFQPLGATGEYEFAWVQLTAGAVPKTFPKGSCGYGRHEASSAGPFSVTVWGTGNYASYGFAGGMGSRPLNEVAAPVPK